MTIEKSSVSNDDSRANGKGAFPPIPTWHLELIEAAAQLPIFLIVEDDKITGKPYIDDERYAQVSLNWQAQGDAFPSAATLLPIVKQFVSDFAAALFAHLRSAALEAIGQSQLTSLGQVHHIDYAKHTILTAWLRVEPVTTIIELGKIWHIYLQTNDYACGPDTGVDKRRECAWRTMQEHEAATSFRTIYHEIVPTLGLASASFRDLPSVFPWCGNQPIMGLSLEEQVKRLPNSARGEG